MGPVCRNVRADCSHYQGDGESSSGSWLPQTLYIDDAARAVIFFSGRPFPRIEEKVLSVGGSLLWQVVTQIDGTDGAKAGGLYRKHGDLGSRTEELLEGKKALKALSLGDLE